jgi:transcriptional regulator with XRE-family HTH domain
MTANDLGSTLRAWRGRVTPETVGLPAGGRRRSTGLRREELAMLAGVSVDYLTRLEQGRATNPSAQVLAALARSLQLSVEERDHLYLIARQPVPRTGQMSTHVTPGIQRLMRRMEEFPVSVHDAAWNIVAWNPAWAALMGDPSALRGRDRNILWRAFVGDQGQTESRLVRTEADAAAFEVGAVADLRTASGRYPEDEGLSDLIADLRRASSRFRELWDLVAVGSHLRDVKTVNHPQLGTISLDCDVLTVEGSDLRLIVYTAEPGSPAAAALAMLRVIGIQTMQTT